MTARRDADPSVDRNVVLPSAQTIPAGAVAINSYELFFAGLSYGISDHLQLSLTTLLPIVSDTPFILVTAMKWNFHRSERTVVSVQPTVTIARESGNTGGTFGFSVMADRVIGDSGKVSLTGGLMTQTIFGGNVTSDLSVTDGAFLLLWGSIAGQVHKNVKLLGELVLPGGYTWANGGDFTLVDEALIFGYGVRFFGETVAVDASFLRPINPNVDVGLRHGDPLLRVLGAVLSATGQSRNGEFFQRYAGLRPGCVAPRLDTSSIRPRRAARNENLRRHLQGFG